MTMIKTINNLRVYTNGLVFPLPRYFNINISLSVLGLISGLYVYNWHNIYLLHYISLILAIATVSLWFRDIIEGALLGFIIMRVIKNTLHFKFICNPVAVIKIVFIFARTLYICFLVLYAIVGYTFNQELCINNLFLLNFLIEILSTNGDTFGEGFVYSSAGEPSGGGGRSWVSSWGGGPSGGNGPNIPILYNQHDNKDDPDNEPPYSVLPEATDVKPICGPVSALLRNNYGWTMTELGINVSEPQKANSKDLRTLSHWIQMICDSREMTNVMPGLKPVLINGIKTYPIQDMTIDRYGPNLLKELEANPNIKMISYNSKYKDFRHR